MDFQRKENCNTFVREGHGSAPSYSMNHESVRSDLLSGLRLPSARGYICVYITGCLKSQESDRNCAFLGEAKIVVIGIFFLRFL